MIDPRALQQHFKKVHQKQEAPRNLIPRITETKPLTSIQPIQIPTEELIPVIQPIIDTSMLQEELKEVTEALVTLKQSLSETSIEVSKIEPITITTPVSVIVEEKPITVKSDSVPIKEEENLYGYSPIPERPESDDYNPYGYYFGPKF